MRFMLDWCAFSMFSSCVFWDTPCGFGFRVWDVGLRVWGLRFGVWGLEFGVYGVKFGVKGFAFRYMV